MPDPIVPDSPEFDDELAEFTDRLLGGEFDKTPELAETPELRRLQETVLRMQRAFGQEQPDLAMARRVESRLKREWPRSGLDRPKQSAWARWWQALTGRGSWQAPRARRQAQTRALALALLVLLPVALVLLTGTETGRELLSGATVLFGLDPDPLFGQNERISLTSTGLEVQNDSWAASLSADGRTIVFQSAASDLVPNDGNNAWDIFIRDRYGATTTRLSLGGQEANGNSLNPAISAGGRYVAYESMATNLVGDDGNNVRDIFVYDRHTGLTQRVSRHSSGQESNGDSRAPAISADGRWVVFYSEASNLVDGDANNLGDVFLHDRQTGLTQRLSLGLGGQEADGESRNPAISADGQVVVFESMAGNLVNGDGNGKSDIFAYEVQTGAIGLVSVGQGGQPADGDSFSPAVSADGSLVAFHSMAANLVAGDDNEEADVFVYDRVGGVMERVSVNSSEGQADDSSGYAAISADGRMVAFSSFARNLHPNDQPGDRMDVFVRDRLAGETELASADLTSQEPDGASVNAALSADGRFVVFDSTAGDLVAGDTNGRVDVFVRDRHPALVLTASYPDGAPGSYFTITGTHLLREMAATISVNGVVLGTVEGNDEHQVVFRLETAGATPGVYLLTAVADDGGLAVLRIVLDPNAPSRPQ
ncbi:MAG: hypothetical protein L0322_31090, partial [Chloroflexi bacterium]|nr:hypothetical protein [Chloroflexota bacterium]